MSDVELKSALPKGLTQVDENSYTGLELNKMKSVKHKINYASDNDLYKNVSLK